MATDAASTDVRIQLNETSAPGFSGFLRNFNRMQVNTERCAVADCQSTRSYGAPAGAVHARNASHTTSKVSNTERARTQIAHVTTCNDFNLLLITRLKARRTCVERLYCMPLADHSVHPAFKRFL